MYKPIIVQFTDYVGEFGERIPVDEVTELQNQMNCNLDSAESNSETWFDEEIPVSHVTVIDEDEFFERYFNIKE